MKTFIFTNKTKVIKFVYAEIYRDAFAALAVDLGSVSKAREYDRITPAQYLASNVLIAPGK